MKIKQLGIFAVFAFSTSAFAQPLYEIRPSFFGGYDVYAPRGVEAPRQKFSDVDLVGDSRPVVTPQATAAMSQAFRDGFMTTADIMDRVGERAKATEKYEIENMRLQTRLMQQRARIELEQHREDLEARRQAREADLAEAKLRKELAEAKLAELKTKQAEEKARKDADPIRRQEAQMRFDAIAAQVQRESAEARAKQKTVTLTPEQSVENRR